jgi:hypothetical protein
MRKATGFVTVLFNEDFDVMETLAFEHENYEFVIWARFRKYIVTNPKETPPIEVLEYIDRQLKSAWEKMSIMKAAKKKKEPKT